MCSVEVTSNAYKKGKNISASEKKGKIRKKGKYISKSQKKGK